MFQTNGAPAPAEKIIIPAEEKFLLEAIVSPDGPTIRFDDFKNRYGSFNFYFNSDVANYEIPFSEADVQSIIDHGYSAVKEATENNKMFPRPPGVIVKD